MKCTAEFGYGDERSDYRYKLGRYWDDERGLFDQGARWEQVALFIMLNPSTADARIDDPTVAKCIRLARRWGFGGLEVRNIFAIRGTDPAILRQVEAPVGGDKANQVIVEAAQDARTGVIVAAWGNHGAYKGRSRQVRTMLESVGKPVYCFKVSNQAEPEHPLYQLECELEDLQRWL
jgi:hypothetical protein